MIFAFKDLASTKIPITKIKRCVRIARDILEVQTTEEPSKKLYFKHAVDAQHDLDLVNRELEG